MNNYWDTFAFQGENKLRNYFEGWYYKIVDKSEKNIYAVIPGVSRGRSSEDEHSFIQVLSESTGVSFNIKYDIKDFTLSSDGRIIRIGDSYFTKMGMFLNIDDDRLKMEGKLDFKGMYLWPQSLKAPNSMGWYYYMPFMECYHGIISLNHTLSGSLKIDGELRDFTLGKGYLEKDWGKSFPTSWIWFQSNHFDKTPVSLTLSVARIPFLGTSFTGFIAGLLIGKKLFRFTTYTKAAFKDLSISGDKIYQLFEGKRYKLEVLIDRAKTSKLMSPKMGLMERPIEETMSAGVRIRLYDTYAKGGELVFESCGRNGGLEVMGDIDELRAR